MINLKFSFMPKYSNQFRMPDHIEQVYKDEERNMIGTLRIKPSGIAWKSKNHHKFFSVSLDDFTEWIQSDEADANKTKS